MPALHHPQLETFAQHYAVFRHTKKARLAAGFPSQSDSLLLVQNRAAVRERIAELIGSSLDAAGISAERVMTELARCAFSDIRDIYDEHGQLVPIHDLNDDVAATISKIEVETKYEINPSTGDRYPVSTRKVHRVDKMAALGLLAKHFKIVGDEGDGVNALASALADRLKMGRQRAFADPSEIEDARIIEPAAPSALQHLGAVISRQPLTVAAAVPQETDDEQLW